MKITINSELVAWTIVVILWLVGNILILIHYPDSPKDANAYAISKEDYEIEELEKYLKDKKYK